MKRIPRRFRIGYYKKRAASKAHAAEVERVMKYLAEHPLLPALPDDSR